MASRKEVESYQIWETYYLISVARPELIEGYRETGELQVLRHFLISHQNPSKMGQNS